MKHYVSLTGRGKYRYYRVYSCSENEAKKLKDNESAKLFNSKTEASKYARELNK